MDTTHSSAPHHPATRNAIAINSAHRTTSAKRGSKHCDHLTTSAGDPLAGIVTIGELERLAGISRQGVYSESFHFWSGLDHELSGTRQRMDSHQLLRIGGQRLRGLVMARVNRGELCLIGGAA